jgi:protein SCO1
LNWFKRLLSFGLGLALVGCQDRAASLPKLQQVGDVQLILPSGRNAQFSELRGKVIMVAHYYSQCPMGCSTVAESMGRVHTVLAKHLKKMHFVSVAIDPADTPTRLGDFAKEAYKLSDGEESWWFATGEQAKLRDFLNQSVGFTPVREKPVEEQSSPQDKFEHDLRIALIDQEGCVRGFYHPASAKTQEETLRILGLLAEDALALLQK